jgi:YidC/Oxa1 family membrane protein insertase
MPAPGSAAERALHERQERKGKTVTPFSVRGLERDAAAGAAAAGVDDTPADGSNPSNRQRQQPMSKKRAKRSGPAAGAAGPTAGGQPTDQ